MSDMGDASFILAINMSVAGLLAATFLLISLHDDAYRSARWIALAYGLGLAYSLLEFAIAAVPDSMVLSTLAYASFLAALAALAVGIARHYEVKPPWAAITVVFAVSVMFQVYAQTLPRELILRNIIWQTPYAIMQTLSLVGLVRSRKHGPLDLTLGFVLSLSALHFLGKPLIAASTGGPGHATQDYLNTTYALFSQSLGSIFALSVALLTLAVYVRTMLADATVRSETDTLSGLLNRRGFEEHAEALMHAMGRARRPVSLIIADIDFFKSVNDTYGHDAGDRVIAEFAAAMREVAGDQHPMGRIGGEEFAIALSGTELQTARLIAEGIRVAFSQKAIGGLPGNDRCTASFGVAQWRDDENYGELVRRADHALYDAKNAGRDCVRTAPPGRRPPETPQIGKERRSLR